MMAEEGKRNSGAIAMEDVSFHQCVKLGKFDSDKAVTFIPPDGKPPWGAARRCNLLSPAD